MNKNLEFGEYLKDTKKADDYKNKKEINSKANENREQDTIINELDEYMKKVAETNRLKAKKTNNTRKKPSGIVYDFIKTTNQTIEDITYSLHESTNKLIEGIKHSYNSIKNPHEKKLEVNINENKIQEKESVKKIDMKNELDKSKNIDKELYKNLEAISRLTNREMDYLNNTYKEYNNLINSSDECNLRLGYDQRMSGVKIYGDSKRSIEAEQRELVDIVKGETKEHQILKKSEKSINYMNSAEKKICNLKSQNKLFDLKGNMERNEIIKEIRKEIERHEQILKDNGINSKEDFNNLKDRVNSKEEYAKKVINSENEIYKQERAEIEKNSHLEKQVEKNTENQQLQYHKKTKGLELER